MKLLCPEKPHRAATSTMGMPHVHMGVAFADGTMHGGHLFETHVSPTMELEVTASPEPIHREYREYDETFKAWLLKP